jgi:hypothetical protein
MELKTKNRLTVLSLAFLAFVVYLYSLPPGVFEAISKALLRVINGG